jgi:DnaJ-class molecular chaperone
MAGPSSYAAQRSLLPACELCGGTGIVRHEHGAHHAGRVRIAFFGSRSCPDCQGHGVMRPGLFGPDSFSIGGQS